MLIELFAVLEMVEIEATMKHMWEWFTCPRRGPASGDYLWITITGDTWSWWQHHYISWPLSGQGYSRDLQTLDLDGSIITTADHSQVSHRQDSEAGRYAEAFLSSLWLDNYLKKYATGQIFTEGTKNISEQKVLFSIYVLHILEFSPKYDEMKLHSTLNW